LLRLGQPFGDLQLTSVFSSRSIETLVPKQKPDYVAMPGTRLARESLQIAPCKRTQPEPGPAQHSSGSADNLVDRLLAGKKDSGKHDRKQRASHKERRRIASTSLALRELFCVISRRVRSRDEISALHDPLG
jgi:hypothetical protein